MLVIEVINLSKNDLIRCDDTQANLSTQICEQL